MMLPVELWIVIASYMQNRDLCNLSLCSKGVYDSIKGTLNIRRLIAKFARQCALSHLTRFSTDKSNLLRYQSTVCISEYQIDFDFPYYKPYRLKSEDKYPWYVKRYVKSHWDLYFIPWQLGSSYEREIYLELHPEYFESEFNAIFSDTFEDQLFDFHSSLRKIKINIENMRAGRPINKSYPYCQKAEPGVTEKKGYIKQYRNPEHAVCYKCHLIGKDLDMIEVLTRYDVNKKRFYMWRPRAICCDCLEAEWDEEDDYDYVDLFD